MIKGTNLKMRTSLGLFQTQRSLSQHSAIHTVTITNRDDVHSGSGQYMSKARKKLAEEALNVARRQIEASQSLKYEFS